MTSSQLRWAILLGVATLWACNPDDGETATHIAEHASEAEGTEATPDDDGARVVVTNEATETHRVWIGVRCDVPDPSAITELEFTLDGAPLQVLEVMCVEGADGPHGQFAADIPAGEHVLRIDDRTHEVSAREPLFVTADLWTTVSHRVMSGGMGHLTTVSASFERDAQDTL